MPLEHRKLSLRSHIGKEHDIYSICDSVTSNVPMVSILGHQFCRNMGCEDDAEKLQCDLDMLRTWVKVCQMQ